jgi:hypothetical protein
MLRIAGSIGRFPMPGLDPGDVTAEGFAAMNAERAEPSADVEEYTKASYGAVSRAGGLARLGAGAERRRYRIEACEGHRPQLVEGSTELN